MNGTSYLLSIDGSEESRAASYLVWELAKQTGARVVAQHVIDTAAVWRFLSYDRAGFIGSGLYMEAREKIASALYSIAEGLMLSYTSQIEGQSVPFETCIDEGDPATEIARRAEEHDLVVIAYSRRNFTVGAMFEKLLGICQCPILILGSNVKQWSEMRVFINKDVLSEKTVSYQYQFGTTLGIPTQVYLDSTVSQSDAERFNLGGWSSALGVRSIERSSLEGLIASAPENILLLTPADLLVGQKGAGLRRFLEQSEGNGLLIWDQEQFRRKNLKLAS